jgi:aminoglycoside phosphotransferase (APT) family kinase protein
VSSSSAPAPTSDGLAALARAAVRDALGTGAVVEVVDILHADGDGAVVRLALRRSSQRLVLKLARRDRRPATDLQRTAAVTAIAAHAGVPVPRVLSADATGRLDGWQHLLSEHVEGEVWRQVRPLLTTEQQHAVHGQIAGALLALRSIVPPAFGELGTDGAPVAVPLPTALRERVRLRVQRPAARALAEQLVERSAAKLSAADPPALCHDDLHHQNLVLRPGPDGWRLAGVLDWDKAWAGPAESDVARLAFWDDMTGPGFWSVYRAAVPATEGEEERWAVHQLLWCLEYDVPTPRHRADTAALCRLLGLTPPDGR